MLEAAFNKSLPINYFTEVNARVLRIYLCESYRGVAIVTKEYVELYEGVVAGITVSNEQHGVSSLQLPYLDKFAVAPSAQGDRSSLFYILLLSLDREDKISTRSFMRITIC